MQEGGLWDTSEEIYPYSGARATKGNLIWKWPNGSTIAFRSMQNESDKDDWLGASIPFMAFDEINTFTMTQVFSLFAANRSGRCGIKPYLRGTCNPDPDSWVANFISWYWDQKTGYPIRERSGKIRWFVRINDVIEWGDTADELKAKHPGCYPKSFTFIASSVDDNKILMQKDPGYRANLEALTLVDRERYLKGNWKIRAGARNILRREWFEAIDRSQLPNNLRMCRAWDLASTPPSQDNKDPDWSCGALVGLDSGVWYIIDIDRFRGTPRTVETRVRTNAENDGVGVKVRIEEEGGASGPSMTDYYARTVLVGFNFAGVKSLKNKVTRAGPLAAAAEKGNVKIVRAPWNEAFLAECDNFKGDGEGHDDQCLVAGTLIATSRGQVPIEQVVVGDMVWTRCGLRPVLWSGKTSDSEELFELSWSGVSLVGTGGHPIFDVDKKEFTRLDSISCTINIAVCKKWKLLNTVAKLLGAIQIHRSGVTGFTGIECGLKVGSGGQDTCIRKFGSTTMVKEFQTAIASTIKMAIRRTTNHLISPALHPESICGLSRQWDHLIPTQLRKTWTESGHLQRRGINQRRVMSGIKSTPLKAFLKPLSQSTITALSVARSVASTCHSLQNFVHVNVQQELGTGRSLGKLQRIVSGVVNYFTRPNIIRGYTAHVIALPNRGAVFNVKVGGENEYFANGVLVHNCDAVSLGINELRQATGVWKIAVPTPTGKYEALGGATPTGRYTPLGA